jgi:hypothetical protein
MTELYPSYFQKLDRAEKHLVELAGCVNAWIEARPYGIVVDRSGPSPISRLSFHSQPENTEIAVVAADVIYNLRSALDHIACALVPREFRRSIYFPILWQGVWEPGTDADGVEKVKQRGHWTTWTRQMPPGAVSILKEVQPPDIDGFAEAKLNTLRFLNNLAVTDRHTRLPLVTPGLQNVTVKWKTADGFGGEGTDPRTYKPTMLVKPNADLSSDLPRGARDLQIFGTPVVAVRFPQLDADAALLGPGAVDFW